MCLLESLPLSFKNICTAVVVLFVVFCADSFSPTMGTSLAPLYVNNKTEVMDEKKKKSQNMLGHLYEIVKGAKYTW